MQSAWLQLAQLFTFPGHAAEVPVHASAGSQPAVESRQTVPPGTNVSIGQAALAPVHFSATSQTPAALRHVTPAPTSTSGGHAPLAPLHTSAVSHGPAEARHVTEAPRNAHVPFDGAPAAVEQASHGPPAQAELQQTPSTQNPDAHSTTAPQGAPSVFFGTQLAPLQ